MDVELTLIGAAISNMSALPAYQHMYLFNAMGRPVEDYRNAVHDLIG